MLTKDPVVKKSKSVVDFASFLCLSVTLSLQWHLILIRVKGLSVSEVKCRPLSHAEATGNRCC